MTVSKFIQQFNEISAKIKNLNDEIQVNKNEFLEKRTKIQENYLSVKNSTRDFLSSIKNIIDQVLQIYSTEIKLENGKLICNQGSTNNYSYDENNFNDILQKLEKYLIDGLKNLYVTADPKSLLTICSIYNTIVDIFNSLEKFYNEQVLKEQNIVNQKNEILNGEINRLDIEKEILNKKILSTSSLNKTLNFPRIDNSISFEKKYVDKIEIPFAVLTNKNFMTSNQNIETIIDYRCFDLSENGILYIKAKSKDISSNNLLALAENLIIRELVCYPGLSKKFVVCDATNSFELRSFIAKISGKVPELIMKNSISGDDIYCTEESISMSLEEVGKIINNRITLLGRSGERTILEYNSRVQDNIQPLIFVTLYGYPYGFSHAQKHLDSLFANGKRAGVYFSIFSNTEAKLDSWIEDKFPHVENYSSLTCEYDGLNNSIIFDSQQYITDKIVDNFDINKLLEEVVVKKEKEEDFVDFSSILPKEDFAQSNRRNKYSKEVVLPIGKRGSGVVSVTLDADGDTHVIMCGATGSGKSSLLNTFILSATSLYSPEELEVYIFAMIKSEMVVYKEHKLPHLKTIITNDDVVGANEILEYLLAEQQRREKIFAGNGNISQYNALVEKEKRLPRILIIIDEYQKLVDNDNALNQICVLAQSGRSCGMSLILSAPTVPTLFNKQALTNFAHKFEFKSTTAGELIPEADSRKSELDSLKGLCLYTSKNNAVGADLIRVAYWDKHAGGLEKIIDGIAKKYNNFSMKLNNKVESVIINSEENLPVDIQKSKRVYDEDGICLVPLGNQYLSNAPVNFSFSSTNNKLCVCGDYLQTKSIEVALIKEFLRLSTNATTKTVFYLDFNQNPNWRKKENVLKPRINDWTIKTKGRFAYYPFTDCISAVEEIEEIIKSRQDIICEDFSPILVVLSSIENINGDDEEELDEKLEWVLKNGKSANVFFAVQFSEFLNRANNVYRSLDGIIKDAIILPDKMYEGEKYSSSKMQEFLEYTQAGETSAKNLIASLKVKALDYRICILCRNNKYYTFVPYTYTEEFFKNLKL